VTSGDRSGHVEVVAARGAVPVDAVDDDLARAERLAAPHPLEGVEPGGPAGTCLLYPADAADDLHCVDLVGRRIIKKKNICTH